MRHLLTAVLLAAGASAQQNLIVNGGFEFGPGTTSNTTVFSPSTAFQGWLVSAGSVDQVFEWTTAEGVYCIDLDGLSAGTIQQTVATTSGGSYDLSFLLAANPNAGGVVTVRATAGSSSQSFTFDPTGHSSSSMGWTRVHLTFVAQSTTTTIELRSLDNPSSSNGPAIDDVILIDRTSGYADPFGMGCGAPGAEPTVSPNQTPFVGRPFSVLLGNLPANELALVGIGFDVTAWPNPLQSLAPYGMPGCYLYALPDVTYVIPSTGLFGLFVWGTVLPNSPATAGVRFVLQAFVHDASANPTGISTTSALACLIGH
ncbi:MAG: DUF642 domain-containing protein [Planctomycetota bacterium]